MNSDRISLAELLSYIGEQLSKAHQDATTAGRAVMRFQECEIELAIEAEKEGEAGLKVWAMKLGGSLKKTESNTIKVKYIALGEGIVASATEKDSEFPPRKPNRRGKKEN